MNCMFASDNTAPVHEKIMQAMFDANNGFTKPYGLDDYTIKAKAKLKEIFGAKADPYFVISGTGGNILAIKAFLRSFEATICTDIGHINTDEAGALECSTGTKILAVPSKNGKLSPESLDMYLIDKDNLHRTKPTLVSITQSTEHGTLYSLEEIKAICKKAHENNMYVHMDGSRIANALTALNISAKEMTIDAGIDVLSFGAAKNGVMFGEAVVFFKEGFSEHFFRLRKQAFQHISKQRFLSAQMLAYLEDNLWLENAKIANDMAQYLASELAQVESVKISRKTEVNAVFAIMPRTLIDKLHKEYYFYIFTPELNEVRLMCNFATKKEDIDSFIEHIKACA